jgi:hypothetical protein
MAMGDATTQRVIDHPLIRGLTTLALDSGDFVIFGSAPLLVHGFRATLGDLDIVARGTAWEQARRFGKPAKGTVTGGEAAHFPEERITVFRNWISPAWDIDNLIERAEIIGGLRFATLADVVAYKLMLRRPKDIADIQRIVCGSAGDAEAHAAVYHQDLGQFLRGARAA